MIAPRIETPPNNLEAEQTILGGMMLVADLTAHGLEHLTADQFYREAHQRIFSTMRALADQGIPVDLISVSESMRRDGILESCGGLAYFCTLMDMHIYAEKFLGQVEIVRETAWARSLGAAFLSGHHICMRNRGGAETRESLRHVRDLLDAMPADPADPSHETTRDLLLRMMQETLSRETPKALVGTPTGFPRLDMLTRGLRRGEVVLAAALTKIGKSSLAVSLMRHIHATVPVYYLNLEMDRESLLFRLLAMMTGIPARDLESEVLDSDGQDAYARAMDAIIHGRRFEVEFLPELTVARARDLLRTAMKSWQPELVIVDYLQLMTDPGGKFRARHEELSAISKGLKGLAGEFDVPVLVLAQINRRAEKQEGRPHYYDLNETGAAAMDAAVTMILHRERDEDSDATSPMTPVPAEIAVELNRHGPSGIVPCWFTPGLTLWTEDHPLTRPF